MKHFFIDGKNLWVNSPNSRFKRFINFGISTLDYLLIIILYNFIKYYGFVSEFKIITFWFKFTDFLKIEDVFYTA